MLGHVVVVLSFRGRQDTLACLDALLATGHDYSVLVVDNGSFDGVLEETARRHPDAFTLQTGRNLGFAGGMNAGLRWAMDRGAQTVTVLNNDTLCTPDAVRALESCAESGAIVSPQVDYLASPDRIWFAGGVVDADTALPRHLGETELEALPSGACSPTDTLAGCCLTARADVWRRVGLFDERYFLLFEDAELSLRAARLGVPLLVCRQIRILHRVSASFTARPCPTAWRTAAAHAQPATRASASLRRRRSVPQRTRSRCPYHASGGGGAVSRPSVADSSARTARAIGAANSAQPMPSSSPVVCGSSVNTTASADSAVTASTATSRAYQFGGRPDFVPAGSIRLSMV